MAEYFTERSLLWEVLYIRVPSLKKTKQSKTPENSLCHYLARRSFLNDILCLQPDRPEDTRCKQQSGLGRAVYGLLPPAPRLGEEQRSREQPPPAGPTSPRRKITQRNDGRPKRSQDQMVADESKYLNWISQIGHY